MGVLKITSFSKSLSALKVTLFPWPTILTVKSRSASYSMKDTIDESSIVRFTLTSPDILIVSFSKIWTVPIYASSKLTPTAFNSPNLETNPGINDSISVVVSILEPNKPTVASEIHSLISPIDYYAKEVAE